MIWDCARTSQFSAPIRRNGATHDPERLEATARLVDPASIQAVSRRKGLEGGDVLESSLFALEWSVSSWLDS